MSYANSLKSKGPQRSCIACRHTADKSELVRYVLSPDDKVLVDYRQRLPGRGAYTCCKQQCLLDAVKKNAFQRSFRKTRQPIESSDLLEQLIDSLEQKIFNLIGMARKSRQITSGTQAVLDALKKDQKMVLILVSDDISTAIGNKIQKLAEQKSVCFIQLFNKFKMGQLIGKEERSAIAIKAGMLAQRLLFELHRYEQLVREI